jgi:hypothetical protein
MLVDLFFGSPDSVAAFFRGIGVERKIGARRPKRYCRRRHGRMRLGASHQSERHLRAFRTTQSFRWTALSEKSAKSPLVRWGFGRSGWVQFLSDTAKNKVRLALDEGSNARCQCCIRQPFS